VLSRSASKFKTFSTILEF
jgi:vacuolar protein sorting-associated protein 35